MVARDLGKEECLTRRNMEEYFISVVLNSRYITLYIYILNKWNFIAK